MKILLVDDNSLIRETLAEYLSGELGISILQAKNGTQGISIYRKERPSLIVVDLNMPIMNGKEMVELIRKEDKETKIICLSMMDDSHSIREMKSVGVDNYIIKDGDFSPILESIKNLTY